jgi:rubredoxin
MQVLGFSPRVYEAIREFFSSKPVVEMKQNRIADESSPLVKLVEMRCQRCNWQYAPNIDPPPADVLRATTWTHAWDQQSRASYCGGQFLLTTEPV